MACDYPKCGTAAEKRLADAVVAYDAIANAFTAYIGDTVEWGEVVRATKAVIAERAPRPDMAAKVLPSLLGIRFTHDEAERIIKEVRLRIG